MLCKSVLETIERGGVHFEDLDKTYCLSNQTFNWFNSTDSIPLRQLVRMKQLQTECPFIPGYGNCTCDAERMTYEVCLDLFIIFELCLSTCKFQFKSSELLSKNKTEVRS